MAAAWPLKISDDLCLCTVLEVEYSLKGLIEMHVSAINTTTEQIFMSILEMISKRNKDQGLLYDELVYIHTWTYMLPLSI